MSKRKKDIYDKEVARLTKNPELIYDCWTRVGESTPIGSPLFGYATFGRDGQDFYDGTTAGCLTMIIEFRDKVAATPKLTKLIKSYGDRLPHTGSDIKPEHLPLFAKLQRIVDKELGRSLPSE